MYSSSISIHHEHINRGNNYSNKWRDDEKYFEQSSGWRYETTEHKRARQE
jgi:hypothetical protein